MAKPAEKNSSVRLLGSKAGAKIGVWYVRICNPYIEEWKMSTKKGTVDAKKLIVRLVSDDVREYCIGVVPFSFQDTSAANKAALAFLPDTVWKLEKVELIEGADLKFMGSSVNVIVDLSKTKCTKKLTFDVLTLYACVCVLSV